MKNILPARVLGHRIWTEGRIDELAGELITSLTVIASLFEARSVKPRSGGDKIAWGQYLDENHHSNQQWGFYGTSAGLQVLAIPMQRAGVADVYSRPPLDDAMALPRDSNPPEDLFRDKRASDDKNDFKNVVKLGAIADALCLNNPADVPIELTPPLVDELIGLAGKHPYWSTRPEGEERRKDRDFATAYLVAVLRRYRKFRESPLWASSRSWLAQRVNDDGGFCQQTTLLALTGLALSPHGKETQADVMKALDKCEGLLLQWARAQKTRIILTRPVFNGFSLGRRNDYIFLHPELLVALFVLGRRPTNTGLRFALDVLEALQTNIDRNKGFMGHDAMITSVDQLWAARLIDRFLNLQGEEDRSKRLVPGSKNLLLWHTRWGKRIWIGTLVIALGLVALVTVGVLEGVLTILAAFVGLVIDLIRGKK